MRKGEKKQILSVINLIFVLFNVYCSCVASFMDTIVFQWRMKLKKTHCSLISRYTKLNPLRIEGGACAPSHLCTPSVEKMQCIFFKS